jgi:hypothetical protein
MFISTDKTRPTVIISEQTRSNNNRTNSPDFNFQFTLSEPANDFSMSSVVLTNCGSPSLQIASSTVFHISCTSSTDGSVSASVAASVFTDLAGNSNFAADSFSVVLGSLRLR